MKTHGYKAFNKNLLCRDFQYEIGKTFSLEGEIKICERGFHFCEEPINVFNFYPPTSEFATVIGEGCEKDGAKTVCGKIFIEKKISLEELIKEEVNYIFANAATTGESANAATTGNCANAATTGESANAATTGNYANAATTGESANAATTGYRANAATTGKNSVSAAIGRSSRAKASIGSMIVLVEWECIDGEYRPVNCLGKIVDGEKVKENVFYSLVGGEFVESDEN